MRTLVVVLFYILFFLCNGPLSYYAFIMAVPIDDTKNVNKNMLHPMGGLPLLRQGEHLSPT